jgi:pyruvate dehydrogenase E2 component (dihydrolipoamide acetyltransferase)
MPDFLLPDLGEGLAEAEVLSWRVQVGDHVGVDQVIAEVETAKAVVEVPVPYAGVVAALHAEPGGTVSVGQPLITVTAGEPAAGFREPGVVVPEQAPAPVSGSARGAAGTRVTAGGAAAGDAGSLAGGEEPSGSVLIGYGTTAAPTRTRRGRRRTAAGAPPASVSPASAAGATVPAGWVATSSPAPPFPTGPSPAAAASAARRATSSFAAPSPAGPSPAAAAPTAAGRPGRVAVISPLVRKEARDAGLDLAGLTGTGPAGVVSREDVRQALAERDTRRQRAAAAAQPAGSANGTAAGSGGERRIPLRGARRAMADKLSRSRREIPEATVWVDVDATGLVEARRALNAADPARPVSLLALLARFTVLGLRRYPELNARIEHDEIVVPEGVNLGFAAQTDHGLVVPVVHDAHRLTTRELSASLAGRTTAARERRLAPADLAGGTFTVNNYGVFGVDGSAAIINHPEVAILGLGRVIDRPWVVDGKLTVRKVTELTLAFDHRACDGGTAGGFLRYVADLIESPATALGDM